MIPKLSRPSDLVYGIVKRRIILNELTPETVLTELGLAHEIGCSQGPIREALLRLQEDGLVVRSGRRTIVTRLTAEEADEMLALAQEMPGFVDYKFFHADDGERVSLVTFADQASQDGWRQHVAHREAQRKGRADWYAAYSIQVSDCTRAHEFEA